MNEIIEAIQKYIERTGRIPGKFDISMNEITAISEEHPGDMMKCVMLAFEYGRAKGYRAAMAEREKEQEAPARSRYGQYRNVLLSDGDMEKLQREFPRDWQQRIERLSEYIAASGRKYKNHLAVIRNWARRDKPAQDRGFMPFDYEREGLNGG